MHHAMKRVLIVGGVAGGAATATRLRRLDGNARIVLFEMGPSPSFANCGMPYYIGNQITDRSKLIVTAPETLKNNFNVDVRVETKVDSIDREKKEVRATNLKTGESYTEQYDVLVIATGSEPRKLPIEGIDLPNVFVLKGLKDMDAIHNAVTTASGNSEVVIVGAGYIGLELADALKKRGLGVTVVEYLDQVLPVLDKETAFPMQKHLTELGIKLHLKESVTKIEKTENGELTLQLKSGGSLSAHAAIIAIGVKPASELAAQAGLEIGGAGGIVVDESMRTTRDANIYAVGDVAQVKDFVTGQLVQIPLAGPAARQARIAADNISGRTSKYRGTQGTSIVSLGKLVAAMTGASEKNLLRAKIPYHKIYVHPNQHAGYYPGAKTLDVKLLFAADGKVLGAQVIGEDGVDKMIDAFALAIQSGMTVYDLEEAELAYAPQFGAAKSAVNMAAFVAAGVLRGDQKHVYYEDLAKLENIFFLDVRSPAELPVQGQVASKDTLNIPLPQLRNNLDKVPKDKKIVTICRVGARAYNAARILQQNGFDAVSLSGGIMTYNANM